MLLTESDMLEQIKERCVLINNVGISLAMLCTCSAVHSNVDFNVLPVITNSEGNAMQTLALFSTVAIETFWVQLNMKPGLLFQALHTVVVAIVKEHKNFRLKDEVIATMEDNIGEIGLVHEEDVDKAIDLQSGESMFLLFLKCVSKLDCTVT